MKRDVFERIEKKLEPEDALVAKVLERAEELVKDENTPVSNRNTISFRYGLVISSVAALTLIVGVTAFLGTNLNIDDSSSDVSVLEHAESTKDTSSSNDRKETQKSDSSSDITETINEDEDSQKDEEPEASSSEMEETENSEVENIQEDEHPKDISPEIKETENIDSEREAWYPDREGEFYTEVTALALPTSEYISFELNGKTYRFACGTYGEIYSLIDHSYLGGTNIPNDSYVDELIAYSDISSLYGDIRPDAPVEVYSLKYVDSDYLVAVKFMDFNNDQRYYLYADTEYTYDSFSDLIYALNMEKCAFDGQAINRRTEPYCISLIDHQTELIQMLLELDGNLTDTAYGDMAWETFLDAPLYGGSLSFKWYASGYVTVNAFGYEYEKTYDIGADAAIRIIDYIDANSYS